MRPQLDAGPGPKSLRERMRARRQARGGLRRASLVPLVVAAAAVAGSWGLLRLWAPPAPRDPLVYSRPPEPYLEDRIVRVVDGDTVVGQRYGRIRYIGINTPETDAQDPAVRAMGRRATEVNRRLVEGRTVQLVLDVQPRDRFGRLLAYVWADGIFVNAYLVAEGYAQVMTVPPNVRFQELFLQLQRRARANRRGLWDVWPSGLSRPSLSLPENEAP